MWSLPMLILFLYFSLLTALSERILCQQVFDLTSGFFWYECHQEEVSLGKSPKRFLSSQKGFAAPQPHCQQYKNSLCKSTSEMCLHKLQSHTEIKCNEIYTDEKVPWMLSWSSFNLAMVMEVDLVPQRVKILMDIKERSCHLGQSSFSVSLLPIPCGSWFRGLNRDKSPC